MGIAVNNRAAVVLGERYTLANLVDNAVLAEELGFDYVTVADSILAKPRYMPVPVLCGIAARTRRIELMSFILQPHLRNPVLLATERVRQFRAGSTSLACAPVSDCCADDTSCVLTATVRTPGSVVC